MHLFAQFGLIGALLPAIGIPAFAQPPSGASPSPANRALPPGRPLDPARTKITTIASASAGAKGIAVRLTLPPKPRYAAGAPVAIAVSPGSHDAFDAGRLTVAGCGFIEVYWASPDGGAGPYDFGGPNWILGLRDVIRFALGRTADTQGQTIRNLAGAIPALTSNVGIVGFSHGGNACGAVAGLHGEEIADLAYYVSWESPYGEGAVGEELGSQRDQGRVNPAYDPRTGVLDLSKLAYDPNLPQRGRSSARSPGAPGVLPFRGALFFDLDGDGRFSPETDYRHQPVLWDAGDGPRFWYSVRLLREAEKRNLFAGQRPAYIPSADEALEFWRTRDATGLVPEAIRKIPQLAVIVVAHVSDHMQAAPDHPHIRAQVNAFQKVGARFVRLNPDRAYLEWLSPRQIPAAPDNDAGLLYDAKTIGAAVCPDDVAPGPSLASVAVCDLADRVQARNFEPNLDRVLFPNSPRAVGPNP